ncbi:hypothetical protein [Bifidobacterium aquikefiricola]|uniref:Ethanolamine utilization protein EutL n=1 Tax=Bifidobacterium aquikefiricola TaxID=3059038 RepID=A0AB39U529_9BIFI
MSDMNHTNPEEQGSNQQSRESVPKPQQRPTHPIGKYPVDAEQMHGNGYRPYESANNSMNGSQPGSPRPAAPQQTAPSQQGSPSQPGAPQMPYANGMPMGNNAHYQPNANPHGWDQRRSDGFGQVPMPGRKKPFAQRFGIKGSIVGLVAGMSLLCGLLGGLGGGLIVYASTSGSAASNDHGYSRIGNGYGRMRGNMNGMSGSGTGSGAGSGSGSDSDSGSGSSESGSSSDSSQSGAGAASSSSSSDSANITS